ncbi:MAG: hypothetical protein R3C14_29840 [Caldilineaceae bacterium]
MSQLENLIELIRTVNEVYFITAPERVRAAYILVDDMVELALKTFLYLHTQSQREQCIADFRAAGLLSSNTKQRALESYFDGVLEVAELANKLGTAETAVRQRLAPFHRTPEQQVNCRIHFSQEGLLPSLTDAQALDDYLDGTIDLNALSTALGQTEQALKGHFKSFGTLQHWSVNEPDQHVGFYTVLQDAMPLFAAGSDEQEIIKATLERHTSRNKLYHDHHHTAWSVSDLRCLRAMCDLFSLLEVLFPDFNDALRDTKHKTVRCQIGVLRLKLKAEDGQNELVEPYRNALKQLQKDHVYDLHERSIEHSIVHTVSESFFRALHAEYSDAVANLELRVNELHEMMQKPRSKKAHHPAEFVQKNQRLALYREQLNEIQGLLSI